MVVIRPDEVRFGDLVWDRVMRISIDRNARTTIEEWGDDGAEMVFADVVKQRVVVRVVQEIDGESLGDLILGSRETLEFEGSLGSDVGRFKVEIDGVIESVMHKVSDFGSTRTVTILGVSEDGVRDPVSVTDR